MTPFWITVFEHPEGDQFLGGPHATRDEAARCAGPVRKFYFGSRPVYRLRVRLKDRSR